MTEMIHNNFHTLSSSWVSLTGTSTILIASNTFNQALKEMTFKESTNFCTFHDNIIHQVENKSLDQIFQSCLIENASFELSCDCEMKNVPMAYRDQSKCFISDIERLVCFDDRYMCIEEYHRSSCKDYTYMAWSECGTKINAMIIGLCAGIGIIIGNIVFCYIWKRKKSSKKEKVHEDKVNNNYRMTPSIEMPTSPIENNIQVERQSGELSLDDLPIRVTTTVSKKYNLKDRSVPLRNAIQMGCIPSAGCFPKHLERSDRSDDYYSNDEEFKN